jgi:outer membrane protein OmpA-like peptidoglycan-associated protein
MARLDWARKLLEAAWRAGLLASLALGLLALAPKDASAAHGWGWGGGWGGGWGWHGGWGWGWGFPGYWGYPAYWPYYPNGYYPPYAPAYGYVARPAVAAAPAPAVAALPERESFRVFFGFNKAHLAEDAMPVVDKAIAAARRMGAAQIEIVGTTDTVGTNSYNLALSRKRAEAVRDYMIAHGVAANEITMRGVGKTDLLVQTGDDVRERENRRVDIVISGSTRQAGYAAPYAAPSGVSGMVVTPVRP